jgi:hypothetical protein
MNKFFAFAKDNSAFITIFLSVYLYLSTYAYEYAYLREFDVSTEFIKIDFNVILNDGSTVLGVIFFSIALFQYVKMPLRKFMKKSPIHKEVSLVLCRFWVLIPLAWSVLPIPDFAIKYFFWLMCLVTIIAYIYLRWYYERNLVAVEKNSVNTEEAAEIKNEDSPKDNDSEVIYLPGFDNYYVIIFLFFLPIILCTMLGNGEAANKESFQVIDDSLDYALIRTYGDQMICKKINNKDSSLTNQIAIYKVDSSKPTVFKERQLQYFEKKFEFSRLVSKVSTADPKRRQKARPVSINKKADSIEVVKRDTMKSNAKTPALRQGNR